MNLYRSGDQSLVREINLSLVLRCLTKDTPLSRTQIAKATGLNKTTVSSLIEELMSRGLVHEIGRRSVRPGRPATLLEPNPDAGCIIGVALGVDFVSVVMTNYVGKIIWRQKLDADPADGRDDTVNKALKLVSEAVDYGRKNQVRYLGLGIATHGTVNIKDGTLVFAPNLQWRDVPLRQIFSDHTGLPTYVDNDANAATLAEHYFGVARQAQDFVYVYVGVGVGGGLFLKGELYRGASGFAGEIGHTIYHSEPFSKLCQCGHRGCWETLANQSSIIARVRVRLEVGRKSIISDLMEQQNSPLSVPIVIQAADLNDAEAVDVLNETGSALGLGVSNLISIFNPEMVVIGGPLSAAGKYLLPAVERKVEQNVTPTIPNNTPVRLSAFGAEASVIGAATLVVDAIFADPTRVKKINLEKSENKEV
jgi:glucokinase-like ROK family protein